MGKRIKRLRQDYDWNQAELAARLTGEGVEVGVSHISRIEKSERNPSTEMLTSLARVLGTTTDYLLLLTDDPLPQDEAVLREGGGEYDADEPLVRSLLETISRLSRTDQAMLLGFAERLAAANRPRIIGGEDE